MGKTAATEAEDALAFVTGVMCLIGFILLLTYTAYGLSAWPLGLIKGTRSTHVEFSEVVGECKEVQDEIQAIKEKYEDGRRMTTSDRNRLHELNEKEHLLQRKVGFLASTMNSWLSKCFILLRPIQLLTGFVFSIIAFLIILGIVLTNIDKLLHSNGASSGYALDQPQIPNPIDIVLLFCQKVFPIDYILFGLLVLFFLLATIEAVRQMGIWFFWLRMYKVRPHRTRPQGLLLSCVILMFVVLTLNIILYSIAPQYATFGNQHYVKSKNNLTAGEFLMDTAATVDNTNVLASVEKAQNMHAQTLGENSNMFDIELETSTRNSDTAGELTSCSLSAPADACVMTRMSVLLVRFFYKAWFFGACYFWGSWAFTVIFLLGFIVSVIKKPESAVEGTIDADDFEDSDEELLTP